MRAECVHDLVSAGDGAPRARVFKPKDQHCGIWKASEENNEHRRCSASFGDAGTTASVSCFGNLIQMNQFLGAGQSGMFAMDDSSVPEPYYVCERAEQLDSMAKVSDDYQYTHSGLRLRDDDLYPKDFPWVAPKVKWVNWRWPRYEWETARNPNLKVISQWLVHNDVVLHQLVLENYEKEPIKGINIQPGLTDDIHIRDQNHLDSRACECPIGTHESTFPAPHNYGRVTIYALRDPGQLETATSTEPPEGDKDTRSAKNAQSVAAVVALFVNGSGVQLDFDDSLLEYNIDPVANDVPGTLEFIMAYKLIVVPEHNTMGWNDFLFDAQSINVNELLRLETGKLWGHSHQTSTSLLDLGLSKVCLGHTSGAQEPNEATSSGPSSDKANSAHKPPTESAGPDELAEYLVWRHLEFILSVCAIPIKPPRLWTEAEDTSAAGDRLVALTCGDMSGHRVCTSASLYVPS